MDYVYILLFIIAGVASGFCYFILDLIQKYLLKTKIKKAKKDLFKNGVSYNRLDKDCR